MRVKELLELLKGIDPEVLVVYQSGPDAFESPCVEASGLIELGPETDAAGKELPEEERTRDYSNVLFALLPHSPNYDDESSDSIAKGPAESIN